MKLKLVLLASYLIAVPSVLMALVFSTLFLHASSNTQGTRGNISLSNSVKYSALPDTHVQTEFVLNAQEARAQVLNEFFSHYNSPLAAYAQQIVDAADANGLDYRLLPAIAFQESTLCKKIPKDSFNCWGFGIYSGKVTRFENFGEAIDTVSRALAKHYKANGLEEPEEIVTKWNPGSNGSWEDSVNLTMDKIQSSL